MKKTKKSAKKPTLVEWLKQIESRELLSREIDSVRILLEEREQRTNHLVLVIGASLETNKARPQ